ncbi:PRC-barrel domain containing protein [Streptomyces sp. SCSIO ZS0520]|uniref:PRC-barrel domain containing protein n=1 Tax=Streptomyces sp. SCSIO ZS0520 TaxID=2892996 RepID=UPI0021DAA39D|nr:PRC-barrel domain containing protein [Streptomyces sp. SCSIO ZS0520]
MSNTVWGYGSGSGHVADADLTGYEVEAEDGPIGKVDKHSDEAGAQWIVVDTGVWIFGKEVLIPAGAVKLVDLEAFRIEVGLTREQIKAAPEFTRDKHLGDPEYHEQLGVHYGPYLPGFPGPGPGSGPAI